MINWKFLAIFGGSALFLSLFTGLLSGVAFGEILLRSLFWGVFFVLLGLGISFVVSRFFPELGEVISGGSSPASAPSEGNEGGDEIDIILPDENPHASEGEEDYAVDGVSPEANTEDGEIVHDEFDTEPVSGEVEASGKKSDSPKKRDLEGLEAIDNDPFIEADDIDSLPDLEKFSSSFSSFDDFDSPNMGHESGGKSQESVDIAGVKQDPAKVAKAIHTWIEKDKEG